MLSNRLIRLIDEKTFTSIIPLISKSNIQHPITMKTKILIILFAVVVVYFSSCTKYPPDVTRMQEDLVIYTQVDVEKDFNQFSTFAIVDSIAYIDNKDSGHILNPNAQAVLDQIILNMQNRAFVKVGKGDKPNLGITVSVIKTTNT